MIRGAMAHQLYFDFAIRPLVSLREIEEFVHESCFFGADEPARNTWISWLQDGTLEGVNTPLGWRFYRDSLESFLRALQEGDSSVFKSLTAESPLEERPKLRMVS